jgi:hypothetical protein
LFNRKIAWSIFLAAAKPEFGLETPFGATLSAASLAPFALGAPGSTLLSAIVVFGKQRKAGVRGRIKY